MLYSYMVLLIYVSEMIYLYGKLPFFKIHVNHLMALVPFSEFLDFPFL